MSGHQGPCSCGSCMIDLPCTIYRRQRGGDVGHDTSHANVVWLWGHIFEGERVYDSFLQSPRINIVALWTVKASQRLDRVLTMSERIPAIMSVSFSSSGVATSSSTGWTEDDADTIFGVACSFSRPTCSSWLLSILLDVVRQPIKVVVTGLATADGRR